MLDVERLADGLRHRAFREAVGQLQQSSWESWPVAGPRATLWCARFIADHDGSPKARHVRWRQATGLTSADPGVADHELAMRVLETSVCYDQLQAAELACVEVVMRKAQLCELKHKDKVLSHESRAGSSAIDDDEFLYLGTGRTRGMLMIAPSLEEFVAGELHKEASTAKERRKMREERAAARPPAKK